MSVFVYASVSDGFSAISGAHSRMAEALRSRGYGVDIVPTDQPMWLYCRHKQIDSSVKKSRSEEVDMTLSELARRFGIDEARTARYLAAADEYGYGVVKRPQAQFGALMRKLSEVRRQLRTAEDSNEVSLLKQEEARLVAEIAHLSENIAGDPDAAVAALRSDAGKE